MARFAAAIADAGRAPALEKYAPGPGMRAHGQIISTHRGAQVCGGGTTTTAATHRHIHACEAFLLKSVHVGRQGIARLASGIQPCLVERIRQQALPGVELTVAPAVLLSRGRVGTFPSPPRYSSPPPARFSARRKYGRTSRSPQPAAPSDSHR